MKIRITVTTVKEFDSPVGEDYYPAGATDDDILKIETEAANDDPFTAMEGGNTTVTVEKIV
jgi:hypothetical protein